MRSARRVGSSAVSSTNTDRVIDYTVTLYNSRNKIQKEWVVFPGELEKTLDDIDTKGSLDGYQITVELRRESYVSGTNKRSDTKRSTRASKKASGRRRAQPRKGGVVSNQKGKRKA